MTKPVKPAEFVAFEDRNADLRDRSECAVVLAAVIAEWSQVEATVALYFNLLVTASTAINFPAGAITTDAFDSIIQNQTRVKIIREALERRSLPKNGMAEFEKLAKRYGARGRRRNSIAHARWTILTNHPEGIVRMKTVLDTGGAELWDRHDFLKELDLLKALRADLEDFYARVLVPHMNLYSPG